MSFLSAPTPLRCSLQLMRSGKSPDSNACCSSEKTTLSPKLAKDKSIELLITVVSRLTVKQCPSRQI